MKKVAFLFLLFCSPVRAGILDDEIKMIEEHYISSFDCSRTIFNKAIEKLPITNDIEYLNDAVTMIVELITFFYDFLKDEVAFTVGPKQTNIESILCFLNNPQLLNFQNVSDDENYKHIVQIFSKPLMIMYQYFIAQRRGTSSVYYDQKNRSKYLQSLLLQKYKTYAKFTNAFRVLENSFNTIKSSLKLDNENCFMGEFVGEQFWVQEENKSHLNNADKNRNQKHPSYKEIAVQDVLYTSVTAALSVGASMALITNVYDVQGKLKTITKPCEKYQKTITIGGAGVAFSLALVILRAMR